MKKTESETMATNDYDCYGDYEAEKCKGCQMTIECVLISILYALKKPKNEKVSFKNITGLINKEEINKNYNARDQYFDKRIKENRMYIQELETEKNVFNEVKIKVEIEEEITRLMDEINKYNNMKQDEHEL